MAGILFVVSVPTKEYEALASNIPLEKKHASRDGLKSIASDGNLMTDVKEPDLLSSPAICRSRSEESILSTGKSRPEMRDQTCDISKREMFIGPWRVDTSDLPSRFGVSKSDPDELHAAHGVPRSATARLQAPTPAPPPRGSKEKRHVFMEKQLERALMKLNVNNAAWYVSRTGRYYQVLFSVESGERCEEALKLLGERGIGVLLDSSVSVIPCALFYQGSEKSASSSVENLPPSNQHQEENSEHTVNPGLGQGVHPGYDPSDGHQAQAPPGQPGQPQEQPQVQTRARAEQGVWERFVHSVRARLTVAQVVVKVRENAAFTFDFLLLLIVAALVAALGLLENSTVILVASMLISPLMGPVMAATFGTTIRDQDLQRMGLVNEFAGLLLCLTIGFLLGLMVGFLDQPWPTEEMLDRGQLRSLWVNVLIALLSGAGISIALLRDNTGSLVGVAISASLLPPAVNAGLLWAMSLVHLVSGDSPDVESDDAPMVTSYYSENPAVELAVMGGISLCLTIINIVFIFLTGILMLKVKEVAPHSQSQLFWRHDVKIARDYNMTLYGASAADMLRSVAHQEQPTAAEHGPGQAKMDKLLHISELANQHSHLMCPLHQLTWSPSTPGVTIPAVGQLESLYRTLRRQQIHGVRRSTVFESAPSWRLGSSDGSHPLRTASLAGLAPRRRAPAAASQHPRTPPYRDMLDVEPDPGEAGNLLQFDPGAGTRALSPLSLYFTPRNLDDSASKRTVLSITNETDYQEERRPAKKRRFVVTKADDSELLLPTP